MNNPADGIKIGLLGASLETPNLGVSALAMGAVECVLRSYPEAEVFFLDYARKRTCRPVIAGPLIVQVPLVNLRFSWKLWLPNNIALLLGLALVWRAAMFRPARRLLTAMNPYLKEIVSSSWFGAVAGGDSFSDIYGAVRFIYIALPQILLIILGKPLILLPQTYGPFRTRWALSLSRWIVQHSRQAWCRDYESLTELMSAAKTRHENAAPAFCYDMAFGIQACAPQALEVRGFSLPEQRDANLIGVNVSGLLFQAGYTGANEFGVRSNYRELITDVIVHLLSRPDTRVLLIPHVYGIDQNDENDQFACRQVWEKLGRRFQERIGLLDGIYSPYEVRYVTGRCGFFIGSRMHACIGAVSQGIPAVSLAYSDKFNGVMRTVNLESHVADARRLSKTEIIDLIEGAFTGRQSAAAQLESVMPSIRESVWKMLDPTRTAPRPVTLCHDIRPAAQNISLS